ncbi:MAG: ribbon-helix-helix domain-containing protein [Caulobacteraceae bacterium]
MKVELTSSLEKIVTEKLEAGLYSSPEAVVGDALRQMEARHHAEMLKVEQLREMVNEGRRDFAEGRSRTFETAEDLAEFIHDL